MNRGTSGGGGGRAGAGSSLKGGVVFTPVYGDYVANSTTGVGPVCSLLEVSVNYGNFAVGAMCFNLCCAVSCMTYVIRVMKGERGSACESRSLHEFELLGIAPTAVCTIDI